MAEYIDKQRVIDIINTTCPDFNIPEINDSWAHKLTVIIREALVELVKQAPAADVKENKHGHWIAKDERGIQCSECGYMTGELFAIYEPLDESIAIADGVVITQKGNPRFAFRYPYFCASCGADMRKTCDDQERLNNERLDRE